VSFFSPESSSDVIALIRFAAPPFPRFYDAPTHREVPFPRDLGRFLRRNPNLKITQERRVRVKGAPGILVAGKVVRADPDAPEGYCGLTLSRAPCVPLTTDMTPDEGYVSISFDPHQRFCFIDLHASAGRFLIIVTGDTSNAPIMANNESEPPSRLCTHAHVLLDSMRITQTR